MFRIIRLPFLHSFSHVIMYMEFSTSYVKSPFDHALTNPCFLYSFRNGWEEIGALPILLHTFASLQHAQKKEGSIARGMGLVSQDSFPVQPLSRLPQLHAGPTLCSLLAGQHS